MLRHIYPIDQRGQISQTIIMYEYTVQVYNILICARMRLFLQADN